jgi:hypothetical protein
MDQNTVQEINPNGGEPPADVVNTAIVPGTLDDLANRLHDGIKIIKAREKILYTARSAAIRMTDPEDWLLFKDRQGREVAYLQDCGCDRACDRFSGSRPTTSAIQSRRRFPTANLSSRSPGPAAAP